MSPEEFRLVVDKIRPFTNYIYLHVLGEPLLHTQLDEILTIAESAGLQINITTNGGLLERKSELLLKHNIRQINISLHDAEENIAPEKWNTYLETALQFATNAAPKSYVSLRLWNSSIKTSNDFNMLCLNKIVAKFKLSADILNEQTNGNGQKLSEHIFLHSAPRFDWPNNSKAKIYSEKTCYGLRDHIAILSDGQVIPCCLDADANLLLGNIFNENLIDILDRKRAKDIKKGFEQHKVVEPFCATCGFIKSI
jgi:radical SAM protein with 4Fe4S-binding SPASM domain